MSTGGFSFSGLFDDRKLNHGLLDSLRSKGALKSLHLLLLLNFNFQLILFCMRD